MNCLIVGLIALAALADKPKDMQQYLSDTQTLVRQGKHEEASNGSSGFTNTLEHNPGMYGVRLSFALSYWKSLADVYPPAKTAMLEVRDRTAKQVTDPGGTVQQFHDVAALNRTLGEDDKTVDLFQTLDQTRPELARQAWEVAKDAVIAAKRYDLAGKYIGDPAQGFGRIQAAYDLNKTLYDNPNIGGPRFKAYNENHLVKESLQLISVALALDDPKAAKEIQAKALSLVDDDRLRKAIP